MGKQARAKQERRIERTDAKAFAGEFSGAPRAGEPLRILTSLHRDMQTACGENSRRCWEYLLEMFARSSGWDTETNESAKLWPRFAADSRFEEFVHAWYHEVIAAKANGGPFSEPFGELLHQISGTNDHLGQFLTPMPVVRMMNAMSMADLDREPQPSGMPTHRGLDPACGTGRFMIDALVHHDNIMMHGVDLDQWMVRAAMLNVRLLAPWTSLRLKDSADVLRPLRRAQDAIALMSQALDGELEAAPPPNTPYRKDPPGTLVIGGRAIFIHGDALLVDLNYTPNWLCAGWAWCPRHWTDNLKIRDYHGTYNQWEAAGCPTASPSPTYSNEVQFDYSMNPKGPHP